jgi:hypothetical protein
VIELTSRESAGLRVALLWDESSNYFAVSVWNAGARDAFELVVTGADALEIFHHPYAYAARRGVEYRIAA